MTKGKSKRVNGAATFLIIAASTLVVGAFIAYMIWSNVTVGVTEMKVRCSRLPDAFDGCRIAQVSDLHNYEFGKDNGALIDILESCEPDIIAITGDLVDSRHTDIDAALRFAERAAEIAHVYYVTGNHEAALVDGGYERLITGLKSAGVTVLADSAAVWERDGETVKIIGLNDPNFTMRGETSGEVLSMMKKKLGGLMETNDGGFTLLLSHRPELFDAYASCGVDVALCGHAHGGQVRLPFIGGVYAPNQGFFPKYDAGLYTRGDTSMVVSRGLGNSVIPVRFNDRPEVVVVELCK